MMIRRVPDPSDTVIRKSGAIVAVSLMMPPVIWTSAASSTPPLAEAATPVLTAKGIGAGRVAKAAIHADAVSRVVAQLTAEQDHPRQPNLSGAVRDMGRRIPKGLDPGQNDPANEHTPARRQRPPASPPPAHGRPGMPDRTAWRVACAAPR